jgi:hypothetical protein
MTSCAGKTGRGSGCGSCIRRSQRWIKDKYDPRVVRTRIRETRTDLWIPAATQALIGWLLLVVVLLLGARPPCWS